MVLRGLHSGRRPAGRCRARAFCPCDRWSINQRHDAARLWEGPAMIKDIVLHLSADAEHDVAVKYAVSVAEAFGANLAAVTFAYEAMLPATLMGGGLPVDFINEQRALAEEAANAAMTRLEEMARRSGVAVEA